MGSSQNEKDTSIDIFQGSVLGMVLFNKWSGISGDIVNLLIALKY